MYWADEISELGRDERAALSRGPFLCDPNGRLMLINELLRREPGDPLRRFPQGPSLGWVRLEISHDSALEVWCPLGGEKVICEGSLPGQVISAEKGTLDLNHTRVMTLLSSGEAFLFNNMLFLLPRKGFAWNSFHYHPSGFDEPMSVAIGFRGHARNYLEVLTPSVLRQHMQPSKEKYLSYKKVETYAANVVKELFWARDNLALTDIQARGILQHHKILGDTDLLDLTYNVEVAKWFALHWVTPQGAQRKTFSVLRCETEEDFWHAYNESSLVYKVIVRVLGASDSLEADPSLLGTPSIINPFPSGPLVMLPWNLDLLFISELPKRQSGFGLTGIGPGQFDSYGSILNITEYRYHPVAFPDGWAPIGGPSISVDGDTYTEGAEKLFAYFFPREAAWLEELIGELRGRLSSQVKSSS